MRSRFLAAAVMMGLVLPALGRAQTTVDPDVLRRAAEAIGKSYDETYNAKNPAGMAALYSEDGMLVGPGAPVKGRPALEKYYQSRFDAGAGEHVTSIVDVQTLGDSGYGIGQFSVTVPGAGGARLQIHGNIVAIYRHESGGWKLRVLTASFAPPASPPAGKT